MRAAALNRARNMDVERENIMKNASSAGKAVGLVGTGAVLGMMISGTLTSGQESAGAIAARVQKVEDRQAIEQLMMGDYPRALDSSNWKVYASFFAQDGELIVNGVSTKGPAAIEAYFVRPQTRGGGDGAPRAAAPAAPRVLKHIVSNLSVQLNGDRATAQAYWQTIASTSGSSTIAGAGHYEDTLKKENGVWKFARRAIISEPAPATPATASAASPRP